MRGDVPVDLNWISHGYTAPKRVLIVSQSKALVLAIEAWLIKCDSQVTLCREKTEMTFGFDRVATATLCAFGWAWLAMSPAAAQDTPAESPKSSPTAQSAPATTDTPAAAAKNQDAPSAFAQDAKEVKQIKLTEVQVGNFIKAQSDLATVASKVPAVGDKPDPALLAELESIAKKHGFANFEELDDVAANISIVMAGLDTQTGEFTDPVEALQKELEDVKKDDSIPDTDKKQLVEELSEAIKTTPPLANKENIEVVKAHKAEIEKALQ